MEHLHESARKMLSLPNEERIASIKSDVWIGYTQAKNILLKLQDLLETPISLRMPNILLVGNTNNGKTILVNKFCAKHPSVFDETDGSLYYPVLYVQAPPKPEESRFYNNILDALNIPFSSTQRAEHKQRVITHVLAQINTRIIIIDEIHHILAGNLSAQRGFLNVLKYLSNELKISMVAVGTMEAYNAIQTDPQMANRFEPAVLPKWLFDKEYLRLLKSFEAMVPLMKPSGLFQNDIALKILSMSEGTIGEISAIIRKAAIVAIKTGEERILLKMLDQLDYIPPSKRKHHLRNLL